MKAVLGFLMVFGFNVANADSAKLCDNEVVIQAVQKVMESLDSEGKAIAGQTVLAETPAIATDGGQRTYTVVVNVTDAAAAVVRYNVQLNVEMSADGTCDYIKKTTQIAVQ
jgi:hypothetical protein